MKRIFLLLLASVLWNCGPGHKIIDRPITFDQERKHLTQEYLLDRYGLDQTEPTIAPRMIVLHWTVIPTLEQTFKTFDPVQLPSRPDLASASALNVSSQFVVDRDGTIYRLMPENFMARHVIGLNHSAIGVENVGGTPDTPLTPAQVKANIWLVKYLYKKYPIEYLLGHYEYKNFENHFLWLENDSAYRTEKTDPGPEFMEAVRAGIQDLDLKPVPVL